MYSLKMYCIQIQNITKFIEILFSEYDKYAQIKRKGVQATSKSIIEKMHIISNLIDKLIVM